MKKLFILVSCTIFIFLTTACQKSVAPTSPENAIEGLIRAFEANDAELALGYIAHHSREFYRPIFEDMSMASMAEDFRKYPPVPKEDQSPIIYSDQGVYYNTWRTIGEDIHMYEMLVFYLDGRWYISGL